MRSASIFGGMVRGAFIAGRLHAQSKAGTRHPCARAFTCMHECRRQYHRVREERMNRLWMAAAMMAPLLVASGAGLAQDAERGQKLFTDTRGMTGKPVGNCVACHANTGALRAMIENRGGQAKDPRFVRVVLQRAIEGAAPGAKSAKAQYKGVLTANDLDDLAAYVAKARES
jgi:mono/diheme cytochrome c family protein